MVSQCYHFRIRDGNEYGFDVENYIKSIEEKFKMDIRKHPNWKEIVHRLHVATTDCKRKKLASDFRKKYIIDNVYIQATRLSPFQITDMMLRTCKKWKAIEDNIRNPKVTTVLPSEELRDYDEVAEESENKSALHPNTEIMATSVAVITEVDLGSTGHIIEPFVEPPVQSDKDIESNAEETHRLPIFLRVNQHKLLSSLGTQDSGLSYVSKLSDSEIKSQSEFKEWLSLKHSTVVKCIPGQISIINNILGEQCFKFSIINCTTDYLNIVYKYVTDKTRFKSLRVLPDTLQRLYPGIRISFKFIFKLLPNENAEDFVSSLFFKVGPSTLIGLPTEAHLVPIVANFFRDVCFTVSETVVFPPAYSWHINESCGYPTGVVKVSVNDGKQYNIRVFKRDVDYTAESIFSISRKAIAPNTASLMERSEPGFLSQEFLAAGDSSIHVIETESMQIIDFINVIVNEIVNLALETFIFEQTYFDLRPQSKKIQVYFTKAEHVGYHQSYYDFHLCDPETEDILETQSVLLLAEVLPHPVQIVPDLLDMTHLPITHGFCEDRIIITNNHKVFYVVVKFKLTTKMRKLFRIFPIEAFIEPKANTTFTVRMCSRDFKSNKKPEDFALFTIKIVFSGHKAVYHNIPRLFYEIIAPCAFDFKETYNEKYFKEEMSRKSSSVHNEDLPAISGNFKSKISKSVPDGHAPSPAEKFPSVSGKLPAAASKKSPTSGN